MPSVNRRKFLATSAVAAAAVAAPNVIRAQANGDDIPFALIGAGGQGRFDVNCLLKVPNTRLTAVCEINPECVGKVKYNLKKNGHDPSQFKVYDDWTQMLAAEKDLRAVVIGLPEDTHAEAAIAAMNAGKDVFCEKPMAYSIDECKQMIAVRDQTQRVLQIGQQRRSHPLYYLAERLLQKEGIIGEIWRVDAFWDRWSDWKREVPKDIETADFQKWGYPTPNHLINWRLYRKYGHGLMTENGTHQMDASSWLLGGKLPKKVCGVGVSRYHDGRETHDICSADYLFEGDVIVRFNQDFHQGFNYGWGFGELFLGSEGSLRVTEQSEIVVYNKKAKPSRRSIRELGDIELGGVVSTSAQLTEAEKNQGEFSKYGYYNEMAIFAHAVRNRTKPTCTGEIGLNSAAMTIVGTDAQFAGEYRNFDRSMFA